MLLLNGLLRRIIRRGALTVIGPDGHSHDFGDRSQSVTIRITDWAVVRRLSVNPDLAVGEAYTDGTLRVENGGIYDFLGAIASTNRRPTSSSHISQQCMESRRGGTMYYWLNVYDAIRTEIAVMIYWGTI